MQILVIGGTRFLGRHLVDAARADGHEVTLFNRGRTNPEIFPDIEHLEGDRSGDLSALRGRRWDAVVDTCGYTPAAVQATADLLQDAVDHYTFVSTISVYQHPLAPGADESATVVELPEGAPTDQWDFDNYGELKVLCERVVEERFAGRSLIVRAGLLVGPHDPTDRLVYWIRRIAGGGVVLAPGSPDRRVQLIHARDLSDWMVDAACSGRAGLFNATGPAHPLTFGALLGEAARALEVQPSIEWVSEPFLLERNVTPWTDLPLWLPESQNSFMQVSIRRALDHGLRFRPLSQTVREVCEWDMARVDGGERAPLQAGITAARESELQQQWRQRRVPSRDR